MDRPIVYVGELPRAEDFLGLAKDALYGLGYLAQAAIGPNTGISGLAIAPTGPASLSFTIGVGSIYASETVDATAYGVLGTDANTIVKQGILATPTTLTITPPGTSGFSQVFLVQVSYADADGGSIVPPYFNSANPSTPWNGVGGSGGSQNTIRQGQLIVELKAGTAAPTGSQTVPSPDAGFTPLYAVTVANGATTITSANWVQITAPIENLESVPGDVQSGKWNWVGTFGGTANALTATLNPTPSALIPGLGIRGSLGASNNGAASLNVNSFGPLQILKADGSALVGGEMVAGGVASFIYTGSGFVLLTPAPSAFVPVVPTTNWFVDGTNGTDAVGQGMSAGTGAFKTLNYAVGVISKYFSASQVTLNIAAGTYASNLTSNGVALELSPSLISSWNIVGASAATVTIGSASSGVRGIGVAQGVTATISNLTVGAFYQCVFGAGNVTLTGIVNFSLHNISTAIGIGVAAGGTINDFAAKTVTGSGLGFWEAQGGQILVGYTDADGSFPSSTTFSGATFNNPVGATAVSSEGGSIIFTPSEVTFSGTPTGLRFQANTAGGISTAGSGVSYIPGSVAGITTSPGWYV